MLSYDLASHIPNVGGFEKAKPSRDLIMFTVTYAINGKLSTYICRLPGSLTSARAPGTCPPSAQTYFEENSCILL